MRGVAVEWLELDLSQESKVRRKDGGLRFRVNGLGFSVKHKIGFGCRNVGFIHRNPKTKRRNGLGVVVW